MTRRASKASLAQVEKKPACGKFAVQVQKKPSGGKFAAQVQKKASCATLAVQVGLLATMKKPAGAQVIGQHKQELIGRLAEFGYTTDVTSEMSRAAMETKLKELKTKTVKPAEARTLAQLAALSQQDRRAVAKTLGVPMDQRKKPLLKAILAALQSEEKASPAATDGRGSTTKPGVVSPRDDASSEKSVLPSDSSSDSSSSSSSSSSSKPLPERAASRHAGTWTVSTIEFMGVDFQQYTVPVGPMGFSVDSASLCVGTVDQDSMAERHGIKVGDELVYIENWLAEELTPEGRVAAMSDRPVSFCMHTGERRQAAQASSSHGEEEARRKGENDEPDSDDPEEAANPPKRQKWTGDEINTTRRGIKWLKEQREDY